MFTVWIAIILLVLSTGSHAQPSFFPAAVPLAVRSPHLNLWYNSPADAPPLSKSWPITWNGAIVGWVAAIRVDGVTYSWMGDNSGAWGDTAATVVDIQITPTRSIFIMQAGPMNLTVTFLSPIEPLDWVKQSIPFSYVSVEAHSLDGAGHDVQMYSDTTSEFVTGIRPHLMLA